MQYTPSFPRNSGLKTQGTLALAILGASLLLATPTTSRAAQPPSPHEDARQRNFTIGAGSLATVLNRFATEAGVVLSFDTALTQGRQSQGIQGRYGVAQGFAALLAGSGLQAIARRNDIYVLAPVAPSGNVELGATSITSTRLGQTTEGTGSYTTGTTSTSTKMNLSLRETPQSVSVITRQQMDDQGLTTVQDAVSKTPGLTMQKIGPERYTFYARGFQIDNLMYDGLPTSFTSAADAVTPGNLAMYDRVEVTRGATGLVQGAGNPSAAINLVRKRPTTEPSAKATVSAGSWDNYRSELDVSGALNDSKTVRGRTVITYQDRKSFTDSVDKEHSLFYAVGDIDLSDNTTVTVGASYQNENNDVAWNGLPTAANGADLKLSRSRSFAGDWEYWDKRTRTLFVDVEHRLDNDWKLRLAGSKSWSDQDYLGAYPGRLTSNVSVLSIRASGGATEDTQSSYDFFANGPFQLFGRSHELVVGASRRVDDYFMNSSTVSNVATNINPYTFDSRSTVKPSLDLHAVGDSRETTQEGIYSTARLNITDRLRFILGARLDWFEYVYDYDFRGSLSTTEAKATRHPTRYAGALYDLDDNHTVYASYTDIFQPQTYRDTANTLLEPVEGENYEVGIKGEYFDGALNGSLALFEIIQRNRGTPVSDPTTCSTYPQSSCYEAAGKVRTQGFDLELSGAITPDWQVAAGYTFSQAQYRKDQGTYQRGDLYDTDLPRHQFKLTTMYKLSGQLERWRVGGSFYRQSSIFNQGTTAGVRYEIDQASYSLVDLSAGYKASSQLDIRFALNNLFDKKYYQTISQNTSSWPTAFYGDPRNFQITASYDF